MEPRVAGFIGVGLLGDKMVRGFCTAQEQVFDTIYLSPRSAERVAALAQLYDKVVVCQTNQEVLDRCTEGVVFLAVRPQDVNEVCKDLTFSSSHLVVSVIATKTHEHLAPLISPAQELVLAVPMPPIEKCVGPTIVFPPHEKVKKIFDTTGTAVEVDSLENMRALMTSTCMMAPYFSVLGQMVSWTVEKGVDPTSAAVFITSLISATHHETHSAAKEGDCLENLIKNSQTPGGLNEQSLIYLKQANVYEHFGRAMDGVIARLEGKIALPPNKKAEEPAPQPATSSLHQLKMIIGFGLACGALTLGMLMRK